MVVSGLRTVAQVDGLLQEEVGLFPVMEVPLHEASGRILREEIYADRDLPPFDRVMMDGYAIRTTGTDLSNWFTIIGRSMAGQPRATLPEEKGLAVEVMTGSPLPTGADAVIPYEETEKQGNQFRLAGEASVTAGDYVHKRGSDYRSGSRLASPGCILRSVELGIAASTGYDPVKVSRIPKVIVFGTGDEVIPVRSHPSEHQIRRSNALSAWTAMQNTLLVDAAFDHLDDNPEKESDKLGRTIERADVVIISGAVSKGKLDWIPSALNQLGQCRFHGVRQRPGKPMGFWRAESGCRIFALPGNPVSTLTCLHRYVLPFIVACCGLQEQKRQTVFLAEDFTFERPLTFFLPVSLDENNRATPKPLNNSGDYASLARTDGFVELNAESSQWDKGTPLVFYKWK